MPSKGAGRSGKPRKKEKRALVLASGGIAGLLYQVGVLEAMEVACSRFRAIDFDLFVGVGSGGVLAALLASGVPPREVGLAFEGRSEVLPPFDARQAFQLNCREYLRKGIAFPRALVAAVRENLAHVAEVALEDIALSLTGVLPSGIYVTDRIERYLQEVFSLPGFADDFKGIKKELYVVATDLDRGATTVFCEGGEIDVPISKALAACSAIPMLFAPVKIAGRNFVDGTTNKMLHLSLPLSRKASFILCITPVHPVEHDDDESAVADTGLASIAKQSLRTLLHNRLMAGIDHYTYRKKRVGIALIEPDPEAGGALFYNVRKARTRAMLKEMGFLRGEVEFRRLTPLLRQHGIRMRSTRRGRKAATASFNRALSKLDRRVTAKAGKVVA